MLGNRCCALHRIAAPRYCQVRDFTLTLKKMDEAMEHLKANPFYSKYAGKIDQVKERHPVALVSAVEERKAATAALPEDAVAGAAGVRKVSKVAAAPKAAMPRSKYSHAPGKSLASVMRLELLQDKSAVEVAFMWTEHWKSKEALSAVIRRDAYQTIKNNAEQFDKFLFALPRDSGYEFIYTQFSGDEIHFTPLANFQVHGENAPECLTLVHYREMCDKLGIVLMKGDYDTKVLSGKEAQFLANQVQLYYGGRDAPKWALVETFNRRPKDFDPNALISQLENLVLEAQATQS